MADWTTIDINDLLPGEPWTSAKATAVYENVLATAEGSSGAPAMEVAWHELENLSPPTSGDTLTFTTDISGYRAIKLRGRSNASYIAGTPILNVEVEIASSWERVVGFGAPNGGNVMFSAEIDNIDDNDGTGEKFGTFIYRTIDDGTGTIVNGSGIDRDQTIGVATRVRVKLQGLIYDGSGNDNFILYGIKRTAA